MTFLKDHVAPDETLNKSLGFVFDEEKSVLYQPQMDHKTPIII
jgi:hypothetical protein